MKIANAIEIDVSQFEDCKSAEMYIPVEHIESLSVWDMIKPNEHKEYVVHTKAGKTLAITKEAYDKILPLFFERMFK